MFSYILRRLAALIPVFVVVSIVIFLIIHLVPGDPIDNLLKIGATPDQRAQLTAKYGLDRPLVEQYWLWISGMLSGDFGTAIVMRRPVVDLVLLNLPYSLTLGGLALLFSTLVGISTGALAATFQNSRLDHGVMGLILLGSTIPTFWLGLLLMLLFAVQLGWFPVSGARSWESLVL